MDLEQRARQLFESLKADAFGVSLHRSALDSAPSISAWSCAHHALALRHLDPVLALEELRGLYRSCQADDGLLAEERPLSKDDAAARAASVGPLYRDEGPSWLIGPPVAAYAAARLSLQMGDAARDVLESATRQLDAIWGERLPPDTPLPVILHPLEAGVFGSPLFDSLVESAEPEEWREEAASLTRSAVACRLDPERALRMGHSFVVEDPVFCGWFLLALEETARAWESAGAPDVVRKLGIRAQMIAEGISSRLWWEEGELYVGLDRQREAPLRGVTAGGLVPAAARGLRSESAAKRAVERHLRPSACELWGPRGIGVTPLDGDATGSEAIPWRGNLISAVSCYWGHLALVRAQRPGDARVARTQLEDLVGAAGFREFYDGSSGEGFGAGSDGGFSWPALALEMRAQEQPEAGDLS